MCAWFLVVSGAVRCGHIFVSVQQRSPATACPVCRFARPGSCWVKLSAEDLGCMFKLLSGYRQHLWETGRNAGDAGACKDARCGMVSLFVSEINNVALMSFSEKPPLLLMERGRSFVRVIMPLSICLWVEILVGSVPQPPPIMGFRPVKIWQQPAISIKATGSGRRQRARLKKCGFPRENMALRKNVSEFLAFDMEKVPVTSGKRAGTHMGHVAIRASDGSKIQAATRLIQGVSRRFCLPIQGADGYGYSLTKIASNKGEAGTGAAHAAALSLPGRNAWVSRVIG